MGRKSGFLLDLDHENQHHAQRKPLRRCGDIDDPLPTYAGFYAVVASVAALITFFIAKDKFSIKLLSAFLVGATWPMSFPVALMFALF